MIKAISKLRDRLKAPKAASDRPKFMGETLSRWALRFSLFGLLPPTLSLVTICYKEGFHEPAQLRLKAILWLFSLFALFMSIIAVKMSRDVAKSLEQDTTGNQS